MLLQIWNNVRNKRRIFLIYCNFTRGVAVLDGPNLYYMIYERPLNDYDIPKGGGGGVGPNDYSTTWEGRGGVLY